MTMKNLFLVSVILIFSAIGVIQAGADDANKGSKCAKLLDTVCNDCHNTDRR